MTLLMDKVVDDMIDHLKSHEDNAIIDLQEVFRALSLDTIAYCAFGIEINSFKDPNNVLTKRCIQAFTDLNFKNIMESLIVHLLQYFPFLFNYMDIYGKENYAYLRDLTKNILDKRTTKRGDFIDRLKELKDEKSRNGLSEDMIMAQGIGFFLAGFETR